MEIDTILDIVEESCCCVEMILDTALSFLGTKSGRLVLIGSKCLGLILEIIALNSANTVNLYFQGVNATIEGINISEIEFRSPIFGALLIIFLFERICVLPFICKYGFHPNQQYQQYALIEIEENTENTENTETRKENQRKENDDKLEGINSLWYGSLWNTSDYIAQIYKYQTLKQIKCIMCWYIFAIVLLLATSIIYIEATLYQFSLESFSSTMKTNPDFAAEIISSQTSDFEFIYSSTLSLIEDNYVEFGTFDAFMMFINMAAIQIGLFQHIISFGTLYDVKKGQESKCGKCLKYGSYILSVGILLIMICNIIILIVMIKVITSFNNIDKVSVFGYNLN